jgi:hypothetical protein
VLELRPRSLQVWGRGRHEKIGRWLAKWGNQKQKKTRNAKSESKPREGVSADKDFPYVSQIIPKPHICNNPVCVETFLDQLLRNPEEGYRPIAISPTEDDHTHDHNKGMCIYWKMPKCGFRLPLTTFKKLLLRTWDVTPAQLTGVAWCTITSFEKLYEETSGPLGGRAPTIGMFNHYFSLVASND